MNFRLVSGTALLLCICCAGLPPAQAGGVRRPLESFR